MFKNRLLQLNKNIFPNIKLIKIKDGGHIIMRDLNAQEIMKGNNKGSAVLVYCEKAEQLYQLLKLSYYYFYIEVMGNYQNIIQCFFNHKRRTIQNNHFESRGLFKIVNNNADAEEAIEFICSSVDDKYFPPYKITAFDIECARLDDKFPYGDTIYDRVCTIAFQTVTITSVSNPQNYKDVKNVILIYTLLYNYRYNNPIEAEIIYCQTEKELLIKFLNYLMYPDAIFITGWNIINFDHKFLLK